MRKAIALVVLLACSFAACGEPSKPTVTFVPNPSIEPGPAPTPSPSSTRRVVQVIVTPTPTATATPTPTLSPSPTPTPLETYEKCEDVPNSSLRLDTQGRVAVQRDLVPSQPDGDNDGFACGTQLEHKRHLLASTPEAVASECPTLAEASYLLALAEHLELIGEATTELGPLFALLADDPLIVLTDNFKIAFAVYAVVIQVSSQGIIDLDSPNSPRIQAIDGRVVNMARKAIASMDAYALGIDNFDVDRLDEGTRLIQEANAELEAANGMIRQLCE